MSERMKIEKLLDKYRNTELIIPLIQRNYKWPSGKFEHSSDKVINEESMGERNTAHELTRTIIKNVIEGKDTSLGIIVFYKGDNGKYQILDGQQRIITLSLIWRFLKNKGVAREEWIHFEFERDIQNNQKREEYMFCGKESENSVDVKRMNNNYEEIGRVLEHYNNKYNITYESVWKYIKERVYFIVRETKTPPIDEFLNINSHKTPFSICDYVKICLLKDIYGMKTEQSEKVQEILDVYRKISQYLYERKIGDKIEENELFKMVSVGYEGIYNKQINRLDLLYDDTYVSRKESNKEKSKDINSIMEIYERGASEDIKNVDDVEMLKSYEWERIRLIYFEKVLKGIVEELNTKDPDGEEHPNCNAFNAFYTLNKYKECRFFALFKSEDVWLSKDHNEVIEEFCLQEFCAKEMKDKENPKAINAFVQSVCYSEIDHSEKQEIDITNPEVFEQVRNVFFDFHKEYTEIIKAGKKITEKIIEKESNRNENQELSNIRKSDWGNGTISIKDLFDRAGKVVIPEIQRDYIQGSSIDEFMKSILEKYTEQMIEPIFQIIGNKYIDEMRKAIDIFYSNCAPNKAYEYKKDNYNDNKDNFAPEMIKNYIREKLLSKNIEAKEEWGWNIVPKGFYKKSELNNNRLTTVNSLGHILAILRRVGKDLEIVDLGEIMDNSKKISYTASCVVGAWNGKNLLIYDGQQRLTTFICVIGYLKRKYKVDNLEISELYKKFEFLKRTKANEAIKTLYTYEGDDNELCQELARLVCDQTTESIYNIVESLKEKCDESNLLIGYFWKHMFVELYIIERQDETTQLFMDLNSGLKLEESEIYKAEFNHYLSEVQKNVCTDKNNNSDIIVEIQRMLDNQLIDCYILEKNPEKESVAKLKEFIKWRYVERFHDIKYSDFEKCALKHYKKAFGTEDFLIHLKRTMDVFVAPQNKSQNDFICWTPDDNEKVHRDYQIKRKSNKISFSFKKMGNLIEAWERKETLPMPKDLKLKVGYALHMKKCIFTDDECTTNYNLDAKEDVFNSLLLEMSDTKKWRDGTEKGKVEDKKANVKVINHIWNKDEEKLIDSIISVKEDDKLEDKLECLFYGDEIKITYENLKTEICEKIKDNWGNKEYICHAMMDKGDIIYRKGDEFIFYWCEPKKNYEKIGFDFEESIEIKGIEIPGRNIKKYVNDLYNIKKAKEDIKTVLNYEIESTKVQKLLLLLFNEYGYWGNISEIEEFENNGYETEHWRINKTKNDCIIELKNEGIKHAFIKKEDRWEVNINANSIHKEGKSM